MPLRIMHGLRLGGQVPIHSCASTTSEHRRPRVETPCPVIARASALMRAAGSAMQAAATTTLPVVSRIGAATQRNAPGSRGVRRGRNRASSTLISAALMLTTSPASPSNRARARDRFLRIPLEVRSEVPHSGRCSASTYDAFDGHVHDDQPADPGPAHHQRGLSPSSAALLWLSSKSFEGLNRIRGTLATGPGAFAPGSSSKPVP